MAKVKVSKRILWQAIRQHCLECCGDSPKEVRECSGGYSAEGNELEHYRCPLFPYRLGRVEGSNHPVESKTTPLQEGVKGSRTHSDSEVGVEGMPKWNLRIE